MCKFYGKQNGFTLIEALIAFLVLTVGLTGALLFHSTLINESAQSKSSNEAAALLTEWLEEKKEYVDRTEFDIKIVSLAGSSAVVSGLLDTYTITWDDSYLVSTDLYLVSAAIAPDNGDVTYSLNSYVAWLDPRNTIEEGVAGSGSGGSEYDGPIALPTGNASELDRAINILGTPQALGSVVTSGAKVSVVIGDNTGSATSDVSVELIERNSAADKIVSIYGSIYSSLTNTDDYRLGSENVYFDYFYAIGDDATLRARSLVDLNLSQDSIVDIQALAGSNCVIYRIENTVKPRADYVCVAGQGWNGSVVVGSRDGDSKFLASIESELGKKFATCMVNNRAYKYLIVDIPDGFDPADDAPNVVSIAGQSGLVSFEAGSGFSTDDYFWLNEYFLVKNNNVNYNDGDVVNQDFVLFTDGSNNPDCSSSIDYTDYRNYQLTSAQVDLTTDADMEEWWPGRRDANYGDLIYYNPGSGEVSAARYSFKGDVILGYAPIRNTVNGNIYVETSKASTAAAANSLIEIFGQPEPLVSVTCSISESSEVSGVAGFTLYDYSCAVPKNWKGYIIAKPASSADLALASTASLSYRVDPYVPGEANPDLSTYSNVYTETATLDANDNSILIEIPENTGRGLGPCFGDDLGYYRVNADTATLNGPVFGFAIGSGSLLDTCYIEIVNNAPVASDDTDSVTEDVTLVATGNVIANDTDADGDVMTVTGFNGALTYGSLVLASDGSYTYTLDNGNATVQALDSSSLPLADSYTYTLSDGPDTDTATLTISINGSDEVCVISGLSPNGGDITKGVDFTINYSIANAGTTTVTPSSGNAMVVGTPTNGSATVRPSGNPNRTFTLRIDDDGSGGCTLTSNQFRTTN